MGADELRGRDLPSLRDRSVLDRQRRFGDDGLDRGVQGLRNLLEVAYRNVSAKVVADVGAGNAESVGEVSLRHIPLFEDELDILMNVQNPKCKITYQGNNLL